MKIKNTDTNVRINSCTILILFNVFLDLTPGIMDFCRLFFFTFEQREKLFKQDSLHFYYACFYCLIVKSTLASSGSSSSEPGRA